MTTQTIHGSCQCTDTSFEIEIPKDYKPPIMICHCTHCQRLSGGFGTYNISFPIDSIEWTGREIGRYDDMGDSGTSNTKVFCTKCGSSLSTLAHKRELAIMKIPCLRDDIKKFDITPQWEQFVPSKFECEPKDYAQDAVQWRGMKNSEEM